MEDRKNMALSLLSIIVWYDMLSLVSQLASFGKAVILCLSSQAVFSTRYSVVIMKETNVSGSLGNYMS